MIKYPIGTSGQKLILTVAVAHYLRQHRQARWWHKEAGGQLFGSIEHRRIVVEEATGPRRSDQRTRHSYVPDRATEQAEILDRHLKGLHYIGDWHTHPEMWPKPSDLDSASIAECVTKSGHELNGFILIIVGRAEPPAGLYVLVHDGRNGTRLSAET
jgi:integrative and conjugative element protein (TIGR02256 family)